MLPIKDSDPPNKFTFATYIFIFITSVIFFIEFLTPDLDGFFKVRSLVPSQVNIDKIVTWYPFITSVFLHGGVMHILSNMWFLHIYGDNVEADMGPILYILFYIAAGIVANIAQYVLNMDSTVFHLGASGAIAGVMGYYLVRFPHNTITCLIPARYLTTIELPAQAVLGIWVVTQFFNSWGSLVATQSKGGVAWWAHLGGALFGIIIGFLFNIWKRKKI